MILLFWVWFISGGGVKKKHYRIHWVSILDLLQIEKPCKIDRKSKIDANNNVQCVCVRKSKRKKERKKEWARETPKMHRQILLPLSPTT